MRQYIKILPLAISIVALLLATSCQDVLDKHDLNVLNDEIWEDESQAVLYINNLYKENMPDQYFGQYSQLCDETYSADSRYTDLLYGFTTPSDIGAVTVMHKDKYVLIRRINIALERLEESSMSEDVKALLRGQALFFRAWRNWEMVQLYGGIPIVTTVQDPYNEDLNVPRSKTSESINAIVADLDEAISLLPFNWSLDEDKGRITSGAAAAFKGRVLLNWASPMFNPNNNQDRWQRAYDANQQAIDLLGQMTIPRGLHPDFSTLFTFDVVNNIEAVIYKRFSLNAGTIYTQGWENSVRPPSGGGNGGYSPTWQLISAFPMANGKLTNEPGSGYDETYFWQNRDPRLYATIAYNGSQWEMSGRDPVNIWTFRNIKELNRVPSSGFYNKKATDADIARENISQTNTAWIELRYAEVLLNFAECANEIGEKVTALEQVRAIRERAGIEAGDGSYGVADGVSQDVLRQIIMVERQVEFAFENKRYWDVRRRKLFREDLGEYVTKLNGTVRTGFTYRAKSGWNAEIKDETSQFYGQMRIDTALYFGHLDINDVNSSSQYYSQSTKNLDIYQGAVTQLNYIDLYDFFAIPSSMIEKSPAVEQTKGWLNGTFDPLEE
ncbi:RagB/SusD family nutrient uptake outer membrane protein [uncultured Draconibacterium sp.]|uniref:RagB/SusD family nutrient uptake outer membrane protein n=1 Tax=uncultured Draconibacterium sp. TaxID=1573823 RepID=UPI0025DEE4BB|nr:RagB/SusD family nutrient uptake outer membrane protein [uncultured Draconibacterium sp.]